MILAFYSYKGGVGRTSTALETAARLALGGLERRPLRVVVWDLDLEAPGVQHFPVVGAVHELAANGTADLLAMAADADRELPDASEVLARLQAAVVSSDDLAAGRLGILFPAGHPARRDAPAPELDFGALFGPEGGGAELLAVVANALERDLGYDVVIVDARTGINDLAAAATAVLADSAVLVFRLDEQDTANLATIANSLMSAWERPGAGGDVLPNRLLRVANLVPSGEDVDEAVRERRRALEERRLEPHVEIPLRPLGLVKESVPSLDGTPVGDAAEAFDELAKWAYELFVDFAGGTARQDPQPDERSRRARRGGAAAAAGKRFEEEVAALLRLGGWRTTVDYATGGGQFDVRAEKEGDFGRRRALIVECKSAKTGASLADLERFYGRVETARAVDGVRYEAMLAAHRFANNVHRAAALREVLLVTPAMLLDEHAPAEPILRQARARWEGTPLERQYVTPSAVVLDEEGRPTEVSGRLDEIAFSWLGRNEPGLFTVLGDFGAGKTTFCWRLAALLATRNSETGSVTVPLVVDLKKAGSTGVTLDGLLRHALSSEIGRDESRVQPWRYRLGSGSLVLIVDGFDELLAYSDPARMESLLTELQQAAAEGRVVLTSRTSYFRSHREAADALKGRPAVEMSSEATTLWRQLQQTGDVSVVEVQPFTDEQIEEFLRHRFPAERVDEIAGRLRKLHPVDELIRRPYLLTLVASSIDRFEETGWPSELTLTTLYEAYVADWMHRDESKRQSRLLQPAGRAPSLVQHLARILWSRQSAELGTRELRQHAGAWAREVVGVAVTPDEEDRLEAEVRTALFLVRDEEGMYRFAHRSFLEFFVAQGLAERFRRLAPHDVAGIVDALAIRRLSEPVAQFLSGWPDAWARVPELAGAVLADNYYEEASENALLLASLAASDKPPRRTVVAQGATAKLTGARLERFDLSDLNLRGAELQGADLSGADLSESDLSNANLSSANLNDAFAIDGILTAADLRGASAVGALFDHSDLAQVMASGGNFNQVSLEQAVLKGADFSGANLHGAFLLQADITDCCFSAASLNGADARVETAVGADFTNATLVGARLDTVDLRHSRLQGATLKFASLRGATGYSAAADTRWTRTLPKLAQVRGQHIGWRPGHAGETTALCLLPDESGRPLVASGGSDGVVRVWDPATGELKSSFRSYGRPVQRLYFIPEHGDDASQVMAGHRDGVSWWWWDGRAAEFSRFLASDVLLEAVCPIPLADGSVALAWCHEFGDVEIVGSDGTVLGPSIDIGEPASIALEPVELVDGRLLLAVGNAESLWLWDFAEAKEPRKLEGHTDWVRGLCGWRVADRTLLASASDDKTVRVWDAALGEAVTALEGHDDWVRDVCATTPAGGRQVLISAGDDGEVRLWDAVALTPLTKLSVDLAEVSAVTPVEVAPDATLVALAGDTGAVIVADVDAAVPVLECALPTGGTRWLARLPGGDGFCEGGFDDRVRLWAADGQLLEAHKDSFEPTCGTVVPAGAGPQVVALGTRDGAVHLWDPKASTTLGVPAHTGFVHSMVWHLARDGSRLVVSAASDGLTVVNIDAHEVHHAAVGIVGAVCVASKQGAPPLVAVAHVETIQVWDLATGDLVRHFDFDDEIVSLAAVLRPGPTILVAGHPDGLVSLVGLDSDETLDLNLGVLGSVRALCVLDRPRVPLVAATDGSVVQLIDPRLGKVVSTVTEDGDDVQSLCPTRVGPNRVGLATGGQTVRVWDALRARELVAMAGLRGTRDWAALRPGAAVGSGKGLAWGTERGVDELVVAGRWWAEDIAATFPEALRYVD